MLTGLYFLLGYSATVTQVILLREFLVGLSGSEISFGLGLAAWLTGVSMGAFCGWPAGRFCPKPAFLVGLIILAVVSPSMVFLLRISRGWLPTQPGEYPSLMTTAGLGAAMILPAAFIDGFVFPCAAALWGADKADSETGNPGIRRVYLWEGLGGLVGGLVFTFRLSHGYSAIPAMAAHGAVIVMAVPLYLAWRALRMDKRSRLLKSIPIMLLVLTYVLILCSMPRPDAKSEGTFWAFFQDKERESIEMRSRMSLPGLQLVETRDSRYENIEVVIGQGQYSIYGHGHLLFSLPDPLGARQTADLVLAEHPSPKRILIVGNQNPELIDAMLRHDPAEVTAVALDPVVLDIARWIVVDKLDDMETVSVFSDPRVRFVSTDAYSYVRSGSGKYDLIYLDLPDPSTALVSRYYTTEFYAEVRRRLRPGGVFAFSFTSTVGVIGEDVLAYARILYRTAAAEFADIAVIPGQTFRVFCSERPGVVTVDRSELARRYESRGVGPPVGPFLYETLVPPEDFIRRIEAALRQGDEKTTNRLWYPRAILRASIVQDRFAGGGAALLYSSALRIPFGWSIGCLLVVGATGIVLLRRRSGSCGGISSCAVVWSIGTTGLASLGLEVMVLFAFQSLFGYVYEWIGMIIGLFMAGLSLGAIASRRWTLGPNADPSRIIRTLARVDMALAFTALLLPVLVRVCYLEFPGREILFVFYIAAVGFLTGLQFPIAATAYRRVRKSTPRVASVLDGADNFGAALGGLLTGVFLIPIYGFVLPAVLFAEIKMMTSIWQQISRR